jgi:hypothetical protein
MRCTRCNRPAIPQAVGTSTEGELIYGWCVSCLEQVECVEIEIAHPARGRLGRRGAKGARLDLRDSPSRRRRRRRLARKFRARLRRSRNAIMEDRIQIIGAIGLLLALWGVSLTLVGLSLLWRRPLDPSTNPSPLGNGTPALLLGGGGSTIFVGLFLWGLTSGRRWLQARETLRVVQGVGILATVGALVAGATMRSPRRDAVVLSLISVAVAITLGARWLEHRQVREVRLKRSSEVL